MSFNTDWYEENHRGHIKTAELFYSCKEQRPENYENAGLHHCWLKSTTAERASDCSSVSVCAFRFFLKCILDICCTTSFTKSNSIHLKSCIQHIGHTHSMSNTSSHADLPSHLPNTALKSNCSKQYEDKISQDLYIVWSIRSLLSSWNSWNNLRLSTSATAYSLAYIRIFQCRLDQNFLIWVF